MTIPLEKAGIFIFFFVFPLAFSLTAFMSTTLPCRLAKSFSLIRYFSVDHVVLEHDDTGS